MTVWRSAFPGSDERQDQTLFLWAPHDVRHLDQRILQMGGNDFEVIPIKGDELHGLHGALPAVRPQLLRDS